MGKNKKRKCKIHKKKYPCVFCTLLEEIARRAGNVKFSY